MANKKVELKFNLKPCESDKSGEEIIDELVKATINKVLNKHKKAV